MDKKYLTVSALNRYIKAKFSQDHQLQTVFLKAEISNFKHHRSGHLYFTLKDDKSRINAVMFSSKAATLHFEPQDGIKVIVEASVGVYEAAGSYQLYVDKMQQDGLGDLFLKYEKLKKVLENEGLFSQEHKKAIPAFPTKIGILTSYPSAALMDIVRTIKLRFPVVQIYIFPVPVQGKEAFLQIIDTLQYVDSLQLSTIILARGGGSIEDLWNFNEERLARAIYSASTPIISGVGHEIDFTIADFVADYRAATPTAAAIKATPDIKELKRANLEYINQLNRLIKVKIDQKTEELKRIKETYLFKNPEKLFYEHNNRLVYLSDNLYHNMTGRLTKLSNQYKILNQKIEHSAELFVYKNVSLINNLNDLMTRNMQQKLLNKQTNLKNTISNLNNLSPLKVLSRGYTLVEKNNQIQKDISLINEGDDIIVRFEKGELEAVVERINYGKTKF